MADFKQRIETTYADLRPTDLVIDKAGNAWPIAELRENFTGQQPASPSFWLCDPVTKVKMHHLVKLSTDPVTVSRVPSHADDAAKLEAEVTDAETLAAVAASDNFVSLEEAVAAVEAIGGTVEAEVTAEEVDAASASTEDAPVTLPPFEDMDPLSRRSHLYLLHGIYATDVRSNDELVQMHNDAGTVQSKTVPHVHEAS